MTSLRFCTACLLLLVWVAPAHTVAQIPPDPLDPLTLSSEPGPRTFISEHTGAFNGKRIQYRTEVAETLVKADPHTPGISLVSFSYIAQAPHPTHRPVMFAFNGGPGGSSVFLHFRSLGPRLTMRAEGDAPDTFVDNPLSPLDAADLVFVDPTDTGFSHTLPGTPTEPFFSIDGDSAAACQLVIQWLKRHQRLDSPVYLYGESYGTMRAVAMARDLARSSPRIVVAGLMLGGNSLGYFQKGQMPDILFTANALPMMASVAYHYGKIDNQHQTWTQAVDKARLFARTEYISALMLGYRLDAATRERVINQLPDIIGIPASYFRDRHTIVITDFGSELLRDRGLEIDGDNGLKTVPVAAAAPKGRTDPFSRPSRDMERYAADELHVVGLGEYHAAYPDLVHLTQVWNFRTAGAMALDVTLATVMKENPSMRVLLVQGRYDTLTTLGNSEYIMAQADLPPDRYGEAYYDGGHSLEPTPEIMSAIHTFMAVGTK